MRGHVRHISLHLSRTGSASLVHLLQHYSDLEDPLDPEPPFGMEFGKVCLPATHLQSDAPYNHVITFLVNPVCLSCASIMCMLLSLYPIALYSSVCCSP